ncbi:hypothetical protein B0T26DRAFT_446339 [Lasiosphaeria miniovina]|uniref:Uncharacterized protein n=1 Tax=Lasiosphaeria miniovina TaxID=1954250 RepID=A0AA39ZZ10_9PEZI|nr:uncharacterized protein B0T26DRAFT_446339 [Lasiosphaeria miniovina]KAK0706262.1 hypothetical protein B0T26DRAFT_446339 [Lasiosphaeria miniovina]
MIILRPHGFPYPHYYETGGDLAQGGRTRAMADEVADTVHECVGAVVGRWDELAAYFDGLLGEKKALLDPDRHDTLLTDDWTLSRSRRYFWAIEFLKEVEASVADNIRQAERFLALFRDSLQGGDGAEGGDDARRRLARHEAMLARLEALRARFVQRREEAVALRDGLFNASAVMESRTSTKLGENIKLLTLISIFFLPLSFCTRSPRTPRLGTSTVLPRCSTACSRRRSVVVVVVAARQLLRMFA